jgi:hypothetical protein
MPALRGTDAAPTDVGNDRSGEGDARRRSAGYPLIRSGITNVARARSDQSSVSV